MNKKLIQKWRKEMDHFHSLQCELQIQIIGGLFGPTDQVKKAAEASYYAARALQIESMLVDIEEYKDPYTRKKMR